MPATAAPAPCCSTAGRSAPAWWRWARSAGRAVETVESLAADGSARGAAEVLPRAWRGAVRHLHARHADGGAATCCANGRARAAREVEDALGGVLCRCTGYSKIVDAVMALRAERRCRTAAAGAAVGARLPRARRRAQGHRPRSVRRRRRAGRRALDPRRALAARARALHAGRSRAAARAPRRGADGGRRAVQRLRHLSRHQGPAGAGRRPRALSRRGGAGAGRRRAPTVLAIRDSEVPIDWTPEPPLYGIDAATAPDAPLVQADKPENLLLDGGVTHGEPSTAFAGCAAVAEGVVRDRLRRARLYRARGRLGAARRRPHRDPRLDPDALHGPRRDRERDAARARGRAHRADRLRRRLRRQARPLGPAADRGRRLEARPAGGAGLYAAREHGRLDQAPSGAGDGEVRLRRRGQARGLRRDARPSTPAPMPRGARPSPTACRCMRWGPTPCRNVRTWGEAFFTNGPPAGAFRGFGVPQAAIAHEAMMDALADQLGIDRLEFRHRNALARRRRDGVRPEARALGRPRRNASTRCGRTGRRRRHEVAAFNAERRSAAGAASASAACGTASATPRCRTRRRMRVGLAADGTLTLYSGALDIGQGSNTIMTADRRRCARPAGRAVHAGHRRHRSHRRCRQDLGLAPDLRLGQGGGERRPRPAPADPAPRQCRRRRRADARGRDADGARRRARCARSTSPRSGR